MIMDQLIGASLSHTHYWYEVGMLKVLHRRTMSTGCPSSFSLSPSKTLFPSSRVFLAARPKDMMSARVAGYFAFLAFSKRFNTSSPTCTNPEKASTFEAAHEEQSEPLRSTRVQNHTVVAQYYSALRNQSALQMTPGKHCALLQHHKASICTV